MTTPTPPSRPRYLNLGCGVRYLAQSPWHNVDFVATGPGVQAHDLRRGLPFADASCALVYHSHVLEHFTPEQAHTFIAECWRVLEPGGIVRVAVPDLEQIARAYLHALEEATSGAPLGDANHTWMMLELYDQSVRTHSGGQMMAYLQSPSLANREFVVQRIGTEAKKLLPTAGATAQPPASTTLQRRLGDLAKGWARLLLGRERVDQLLACRFRARGEIHQWMYDRFSLARMLEKAGFSTIIQRTAHSSYLDGWAQLPLDVEPDGTVYKPDSLFMEAIKR